MEELVIMIAFVVLLIIGMAILVELMSEKCDIDSILDAMETMIDDQELSRPLV